MIKEIVTKYGVTYIGEYIDNGTIDKHYNNVMMVSMKPVKTEEGGYNMVPALDVINVFSDGDNFTFNSNDVIYEKEVVYKNFIKLYQDTVSMYKEAKKKHGNMSEKDNIDLSIQRKI